MLIVPERTYRGAQGLFIAGQPVELTKTQVQAIEDECALQKQTFKYRAIDKGQPINRAAKKQQETPKNKQQEGGKNK